MANEVYGCANIARGPWDGEGMGQDLHPMY